MKPFVVTPSGRHAGIRVRQGLVVFSSLRSSIATKRQ
jgi:hypothetical protein